MPEISIIVPVYNVEKYLHKCLDSILIQTFKDFELILIDDGSTDRSSTICDEYSIKDNRIKVIHQKNGGVSNARNKGLDNSSGKYIGFVDSDDFIEPDMYEMLYNDLKNNNADIAVCGIKHIYKTGEHIPNNLGNFAVYDTKNALKNTLNTQITVGPSNKLYKKNLFNDIRYPEGKICEDAFITPLLVVNSKVLVYNPKMKYYYFHRSDSITTKKFSSKVFDVLESGNQSLEIVKNRFPDLIKEGELRYLMAYFWVLDRMISSETKEYEKEYKNVIKILRQNTLKTLTNPYFSLNRKLASISLLFSDKLYKKIKTWYANNHFIPIDD